MFSLKLENENANVVDINDGINYIIIPPTDGFSPPSASLFMAKSPNRKGSHHNGSTLNERNILLTIKILGNIEKNRNALYAWVDTEQYVKIYYQNGVKNVYCEGYVSDCPIDFFTDKEVVSVSITCGDPYWKELQQIEAEISALVKQFTFPFSIDAAGIPFSTLKDNNSTDIFNAGAETGVIITVKCSGDVRNLMIFDADDTTRQFKLNYTIPSGYNVIIDAENSPKTVKAIKPDGTSVNLMRYVGRNPTWFTLKKGYNTFGFSADSGLSSAEVSFGFRNKYLGV